MTLLVLDVNVVVAAHRADHPQHEPVRHWFDNLLGGDEPFSTPALVWTSFLRLVTNRRVFPVPSPLPDAFAFLDATRAQPHYLSLEPGPRHLTLVRRMCEESGATGDMVPDAVLGAVALEHGASIASLDRDFARFPSLTWVRPDER